MFIFFHFILNVQNSQTIQTHDCLFICIWKTHNCFEHQEKLSLN